MDIFTTDIIYKREAWSSFPPIPQGKDGCMYRCIDFEDSYYIEVFPIVGETALAYWIEYGAKNKLVYKDGKNNFAKKSPRDAVRNYIHRKDSHIAILKNKIRELSIARAKAIGAIEGYNEQTTN